MPAAAAHDVVERAHGLLERRAGIGAVVIKDVHVLQAHALQALVEARDEVLARAQVAVRAGPHVPAGLRRDHQLVAVRLEVLRQNPAEALLGRPVGRAVIVRQIEVRDAQIEGAARHRPAVFVNVVAAEVVPQPQRHGRQFQPAAAAAVVAHRRIAVLGRGVRHVCCSFEQYTTPAVVAGTLRVVVAEGVEVKNRSLQSRLRNNGCGSLCNCEATAP
jgi:hypothetical protein